ncbi:type II toxin-antitoxin system HipA family toxin [Agromyces tardus]|uniref:Type II toxin-antitoxin system HipA family toxin n=1 Tax=Agromyces tardus TaxID=2583849 RepID=A0A3M8A2I6_9MICO|nr:HipA domain-containing protein [Agromyces tardus]RNB45181.1 type II toxin-antitoxin system HipA family toxin [Agromyces tardus]
MTADLEGLRRVQAADVFKAGRLAARLTRTPDGGVEFRYLDAYLRGDAPTAVAFTLPLGEQPTTTSAGSLPAFFAGLLPEGHRMSVLRRAVKTSANDELSLLLAVGEDAPGDVQVVPEGTAPSEPPPVVGAEASEALDFESLIDELDRHAIPGVQRKASASMISTPLATRSGRYILKLSPIEYPHLVENEAVHLLAARALKVPVSAAAVVHDRDGTAGLLVRRFDRVAIDGAWRRLALEDATQVLAQPPAAKYNVDSEHVVAALAGVCGAPAVATRNLYLQFLFAWLTGNGDLHAKNVAVLQADAAGRPDRGWAIAPIYDIPCTLVYGDDSMALPIAGHTRKLRLRHWREFAAAIGLPERAAASAEQVALRAAARVELAELPFHGSPLNGALRELRLRRGELAGGA